MVRRVGESQDYAICDFGAAYFYPDTDNRLTMTRTVLGTPHFMAPEQMELPISVSESADQYGLAATLTALSAGTIRPGLLYLKSRFDKATARMSADLKTVLKPAVSADPGSRYPDLGLMRLALEKLRTKLEARARSTVRLDLSSVKVSLNPLDSKDRVVAAIRWMDEHPTQQRREMLREALSETDPANLAPLDPDNGLLKLIAIGEFEAARIGYQRIYESGVGKFSEYQWCAIRVNLAQTYCHLGEAVPDDLSMELVEMVEGAEHPAARMCALIVLGKVDEAREMLVALMANGELQPVAMEWPIFRLLRRRPIPD